MAHLSVPVLGQAAPFLARFVRMKDAPSPDP
jgi:hypothetical protein